MHPYLVSCYQLGGQKDPWGSGASCVVRACGSTEAAVGRPRPSSEAGVHALKLGTEISQWERYPQQPSGSLQHGRPPVGGYVTMMGQDGLFEPFFTALGREISP